MGKHKLEDDLGTFTLGGRVELEGWVASDMSSHQDDVTQTRVGGFPKEL